MVSVWIRLFRLAVILAAVLFLIVAWTIKAGA